MASVVRNAPSRAGVYATRAAPGASSTALNFLAHGVLRDDHTPPGAVGRLFRRREGLVFGWRYPIGPFSTSPTRGG